MNPLGTDGRRRAEFSFTRSNHATTTLCERLATLTVEQAKKFIE
jgi:hypothetical protein